MNSFLRTFCRVSVIILCGDLICKARVTNTPLIEQCLVEMGLNDSTKLSELTPEELGELKGRVNKEHHALKEELRKIQHALKEELRKIKLPAAARAKIEFFERENELSFHNFSEEDNKVLKKIRDLKEKRIKQIELKWRYLLSSSNPKYDLEINQQLLARLKERNIKLETFCRAVGIVFEHTSSRWHELFDMNGEPMIVLNIAPYDQCMDCLFETPIVKLPS